MFHNDLMQAEGNGCLENVQRRPINGLVSCVFVAYRLEFEKNWSTNQKVNTVHEKHPFNLACSQRRQLQNAQSGPLVHKCICIYSYSENSISMHK